MAESPKQIETFIIQQVRELTDQTSPAGVIDNIAAKLKSFNDKDLSERINNKPEEISKLVKQFLHCS